MKSVKKPTSIKRSLVNFQNSLPLREIYIKYLEKNSIAIGVVYSCIFSFIPICYEMKFVCDTHAIHLQTFD